LPERARGLSQTIDGAVRRVSEQALTRGRGARASVYYEVDRTPIAAGAGSFIGELLSLVGARNIVTADLGPFPALNPEYVVRHNPDVIFVSRPTEALHLAERPGWDQIRAVKERRFCYFAPAVRDTIERAGPRVADGMRAMTDCLARVAP
jgi:iron complex transport system substrate-binding protein